MCIYVCDGEYESECEHSKIEKNCKAIIKTSSNNGLKKIIARIRNKEQKQDKKDKANK